MVNILQLMTEIMVYAESIGAAAMVIAIGFGGTTIAATTLLSLVVDQLQ